MTQTQDIIVISDEIEVHPSKLGWSVVRNGDVRGTYSTQREAEKIARELAAQ